ncbi:hypothetical protein AMAG_02243 [Allomyces macrogynus ATCC 38327]|uniref:PAS domain-containing protein n=1 Tax=Allomyces macrogynus (strain ATCC 38327) TaxID=578462 RepID=A0A0L0S235_ALLM3|nr:hypothetical protein AMAG_02243 [Allomyces macrogynus ATCC 38327]|eukprot:KNE56434.1 hypothetical protein AMAG_02243 [Allomyces macrogynus ATCC 38327]
MSSPPQSEVGSARSQSAVGSASAFASASGSSGSRSDLSAPRIPANQLLAPPNDARRASLPQQPRDFDDEWTANDSAALRSMFANAAVVGNGAPYLHAGPSQALHSLQAFAAPALATAATAMGSHAAAPLPALMTAASARVTNGARDPVLVPPPPPPTLAAPAPAANGAATNGAATNGARTGSGATSSIAQPSATSATGRETRGALLGVKERQWAHSLIDKILDLMLVVAPNGTIVWSSPSAPKVVGFPCTELSSHHLGEFLHPEDMAYLARNLTVTVAQDSHFVKTFRFRRKNADYILLEIAGRVMHFGTPASDTNGDSAPVPNGNAAAAATHPLIVPYGPGNVMAAAAAMATAQYLASSAAPLAPRSPLVLLTCREYPQSALTEMLDAVVDLRNENLLLRQRLNGMYEHAGKRVHETSALHDDLTPKRVLNLAAAPEPDAMVVDDPAAVIVVQSLEPAPAGPADEAAPPKRVRKKRKPPPATRSSDLPERACIDCGTTQSPEWRKGTSSMASLTNFAMHFTDKLYSCVRSGPTGAKTLCNACGLRFAKRKKMEMEPSAVPPGSA